MSYSICLCICTYNRPDDLDRCLKSVCAASYRPETIIVSDDSKDDAPARAVVERYPGVTYQRGPSQGLGANRNACLEVVNQDFVLFIDDDVCVDSDFFEKSRVALAELPEKTILSGYEMNYLSEPARKVTPHNSDFWGFQRVPPEGNYQAIVINSTFFPASLFKLIRFDSKLRFGCEEIDAARHAISCGFSIQYSEDINVRHYPSSINRDEYKAYVEASRLYTTFKAYWTYEKSLLKSAVFLLLAPLRLLFAVGRRTGFKGIQDAWKSTSLALKYMTT